VWILNTRDIRNKKAPIRWSYRGFFIVSCQWM